MRIILNVFFLSNRIIGAVKLSRKKESLLYITFMDFEPKAPPDSLSYLDWHSTWHWGPTHGDEIAEAWWAGIQSRVIINQGNPICISQDSRYGTWKQHATRNKAWQYGNVCTSICSKEFQNDDMHWTDLNSWHIDPRSVDLEVIANEDIYGGMHRLLTQDLL